MYPFVCKWLKYRYSIDKPPYLLFSIEKSRGKNKRVMMDTYMDNDMRWEWKGMYEQKTKETDESVIEFIENVDSPNKTGRCLQITRTVYGNNRL